MSRRDEKEEARQMYHNAWSNKRNKTRRGVKGSLRGGRVYLWANGFVTAFNQTGQQILELQGFLVDVRTRIIKRLQTSTQLFRCGDWHTEPREPVSEWAIFVEKPIQGGHHGHDHLAPTGMG